MPVENFDEDWTNKVISCVKPSKSKKYTVTDFWRWMRKEEASVTGMAFESIVDTDGMGPAYDVPRKVKLVNGYTVDSKSIKYLTGTDSTLLDQHNNVLVPDDLRKKHWWENGYVQGALIIIAIIGLVLAF